MRPTTRQLLSLSLLFGLVLAAPVAAQRPLFSQGGPSLGPQIGLGTNDLDLLIGAQLAFPVANRFDLYPSVQIYFPGNGVDAWGFNAAARWWPRLTIPNPGLYVGGGVNYTRLSAGGFHHSSSGLLLLGGWEFRAVRVRPFGELRVIATGDYDRVDFVGGINFRL